MFHTGQQIGVYVLIERLGRGGFGEVWLAEKRSGVLTKKVAVKLPHQESVNLEAIKQEAELWEQVSKHENVLTIFDADIYDGQVAIISEYAEGGSLDDKLKRDGKFPVEQAVEMIIGILKGLAHLHSKNIVHRDIKPQNILLQGNTPRLADFGISRAMNTANISSVIIGTDSYMAPEALDGVRNVQTDIWSVGVVFYRLLKGGLPFPQEHYSERMFAILTKDFEPLPDDIPPRIKEIVKKSLAKNTAERFSTADEMRLELEKTLTYLRNPTFAPTEIFVRPTPPAADLPTIEENPSLVTQLPFTAPPRYEVPPTQAALPTKPTPRGGIVIERKAVENKTLVTNNVGLSAAGESDLQSKKDISKSVLDLTNEKNPPLIPILLWGLIGVGLGLVSAIFFNFAYSVDLDFQYFNMSIFAWGLYFFGSHAFSPPFGKGYWTLGVLMLFAVLGQIATEFVLDIISINYIFNSFAWGIVFGVFIVSAELICWNLRSKKRIYAPLMIFIIGFSNLAAVLIFDLIHTLVPAHYGIGSLWQGLVLLAHAAVLTKLNRS